MLLQVTTDFFSVHLSIAMNLHLSLHSSLKHFFSFLSQQVGNILFHTAEVMTTDIL